jgi:5'(3')-deoxyribonucleotidase
MREPDLIAEDSSAGEAAEYPKIDPDGLAFDIDGVIADTMRLFVDIARREYRINGVRYEDMTSYRLADCIDMPPEIIEAVIAHLLAGTHDARLAPLPGAPEVISRLCRRPQPVLFVTARPTADSIRNWFVERLGLEADRFEVVATGAFDAKAEVLCERGVTHFVEDRLETCFALYDAGITPVLFKQPWNRQAHSFMEVSSWTELARLIRM